MDRQASKLARIVLKPAVITVILLVFSFTRRILEENDDQGERKISWP